MNTDRDQRITFKEDEHVYLIDQTNRVPLSVTGLIGIFFSPFEPHNVYLRNKNLWASRKISEYWDSQANQVKDMETVLGQWTRKALLGTFLHGSIECFFQKNMEDPNSKELDTIASACNERYPYLPDAMHVKGDSVQNEYGYFKDFFDQYLKGPISRGELTPLEPERKVWLDDPLLAGSVDMMFQKQDGSLILYDWKRTKKITREAYGNAVGIGPIKDVPEAKFHTYSLQLNLYKYILEQDYGVSVADMHFVQLHKNASNDGYKRWDACDYSSKVIPMLEAYKTLHAL